MDYSDALKKLKEGNRVARSGWGGKDITKTDNFGFVTWIFSKTDDWVEVE